MRGRVCDLARETRSELTIHVKKAKNERGKGDNTYKTENVDEGVVDGEKIEEEVRRQ